MLAEQFRDAGGRHREACMCPDDPGLGIVTEKDEKRLLVAMRVEVQIFLDGEIHDLLDPFRFCRFSVDMEFSDTAIGAARVLLLDQLKDRRIVEPGLYIVAYAIRPNERHDFQLMPLRVREFMRTLVWPAVGDDADDAVAPKHVANLVERIERLRLLVVVQMGIEDFEPLLRSGSGQSNRHGSEQGQTSRANLHFRSSLQFGLVGNRYRLADRQP